MTEPDSTENPTLQADPVLTLSGGQMTFGQKLICGIVAIVVARHDVRACPPAWWNAAERGDFGS
jgi:hypothetical protein